MIDGLQFLEKRFGLYLLAFPLKGPKKTCQVNSQKWLKKDNISIFASIILVNETTDNWNNGRQRLWQDDLYQATA